MAMMPQNFLWQNGGAGAGPSVRPSVRPLTLKISLGLRPREISRVSGNLLGVGDGFPNTSLVLVEHGYNHDDDDDDDYHPCTMGSSS